MMDCYLRPQDVTSIMHEFDGNSNPNVSRYYVFDPELDFEMNTPSLRAIEEQLQK